jgi:tetratricopeptide (TPR) repeat protein
MSVKIRHSRIGFLCVVFAIAVIFVLGCERKGENIPTSFPTINSLQVDGWRYFQNAQYEQAIDSFGDMRNRDAANVVAYNGLGWSLTRVGEYIAAESNFKLLLALTEDPSLITDAYAGLAMMYFATPKEIADAEQARDERDLITIGFVNQVLEMDPDYQFEYDNRVNATALKTIVAQCRYNRKEYLKCIETIETDLVPNYFQTLVDKGLIAKKENHPITANLYADTDVTGSAYASVQKENGEDFELVKVLAVKHAVQTQVGYQVVSFEEGNGHVEFRGNPIPQKNQEFLVDFYYAPSYGKLLAEIMQTLEAE